MGVACDVFNKLRRVNGGWIGESDVCEETRTLGICEVSSTLLPVVFENAVNGRGSAAGADLQNRNSFGSRWKKRIIYKMGNGG